jgi:outer membrane murein-binding lipoprotein Lpp
MKKYILVFAVIVSVTLAACGSGSTSNEKTDSTAAQVDSSAVSADSTTAQIPADSTATK